MYIIDRDAEHEVNVLANALLELKDQLEEQKRLLTEVCNKVKELSENSRKYEKTVLNNAEKFSQLNRSMVAAKDNMNGLRDKMRMIEGRQNELEYKYRTIERTFGKIKF